MSRKFLTHKDGDVCLREFAGRTDPDIDREIDKLKTDGYDVEEISHKKKLTDIECMEYKNSKFRVSTKKKREREKMATEFTRSKMIVEAINILLNGTDAEITEFRKKWNGE